MKGLSYIWRMALRRKAACLLVLLFTMAATIFMLVYPSLIKNTQNRLDEAYDSLEVSGWILNTAAYSDPVIDGELWEEIEASDHFSSLYAGARFSIDTFPKEMLMEQADTDASERELLHAFQILLDKYGERSDERVFGRMRAYNDFNANDALVRIKDKINWAEGYDESFLHGNEKVCILSEDWGYEPGDTVPLLASVMIGKSERVEGIFRMKVVGTYPGKITSFASVMPIKTYKELCETATNAQKEYGNSLRWPYTVSSLMFTVKDNRQLDEVKGFLVGKGFDGNGLRAAIDDRILKSTVSPIESNLALLEGLYSFFFLMVTAIGFFLSFLLARGRKPEYAVMRMLGEKRLQITGKALCEQFVLCLTGVLMGAGAVALIAADSLNPYICGVILLCYTLGAAIAVLLTVRVNVMEILRDKE